MDPRLTKKQLHHREHDLCTLSDTLWEARDGSLSLPQYAMYGMVLDLIDCVRNELQRRYA